MGNDDEPSRGVTYSDNWKSMLSGFNLAEKLRMPETAQIRNFEQAKTEALIMANHAICQPVGSRYAAARLH